MRFALVFPRSSVHTRMGSLLERSVSLLTDSSLHMIIFIVFFNRKIDDATAVVTVVVLLFLIPSKLNFWCFRSPNGNTFRFVINHFLTVFLTGIKETGPEKPTPALLDWSYAQERVPWGIVLLLGKFLLRLLYYMLFLFYITLLFPFYNNENMFL